MIWRYLNTPSRFDGEELRRVEAIAVRLVAAGMHEEAETLRALARLIRPLLTWYGELINQIAHAMAGMIVAASIAIGVYALFGEFPSKAIILVFSIAPYVLIEAVKQGWKAGDSWFDVYMWSCGVFGLVVTFTEGPGGSLIPDPGFFAVSLVAFVVPLAFRVRKRLKG